MMESMQSPDPLDIPAHSETAAQPRRRARCHAHRPETLQGQNLDARYYDPGTGEFTSVDPALSSTDQPYIYAGDDPVNNSDPTGQANGCIWNPASCGGTGAAGGAAGAGYPPPFPTNGSPEAWANYLLRYIGVPDNEENFLVVISWMQSEGGWTNGTHNPVSSGDWYNNQNHPEPGNLTGVQDYPNVAVALLETKRNLLSPPAGFTYAPVLQAFDADIAPNYDNAGMQGDGWNVVNAITGSHWGTDTSLFDSVYMAVVAGTQTSLFGQPSTLTSYFPCLGTTSVGVWT